MGCISTIITDSRRRTAVKHRPNPRRSPSEKAPAAAAAAASTGSEEDEPGRGDQVEERPQPLPAAPFVRNQQGWPPWLVAAVGDAIGEFVPRCADTFQKLEKIGEGTYSNVYKARDLVTGKTVALKKVRFDNLEAESIKFMAREILVLRRLNHHPNVIKLEGLVTSRMSSGLYLAFEYMEHDLSGIAAREHGKFTEAQVKCYMRQLLSGLEHCHNRDVLHRDIKCSNLLIDNEGNLKIADFGLATFYDPERKQVMTNRVVTLWYRAPELLLGATSYGVGIDLWSAGCILAELLYGKPIMPGRTEFFAAEPRACDPSSLPKYPPSKEMDLRLVKDKARRDSGKRPGAIHGSRRDGVHDRAGKVNPAPEATAENQATLHRPRVMKKANPMTRSEKFPPAHQDGVVGSSAITRPTGPVSSAAPDSQVGNASDGSSASQRTLKATPKLLQMGSSSSHSCHRMLVHGSTLTIRSK
ncbi:probable serine/threonine-protein kinase At1g54610 isoform X2 [Syzygium oleosum]|uniref:probable serine/threonine-protein kinase At1g54610 isoform X2 n=1 Tax=Syzygium oleosum TaxID=219896 RepID=UPI0024BB4793|nr:probable serine/threonine-protein kinase At1g54610 isoform X2 [Syzygium oleosum]